MNDRSTSTRPAAPAAGAADGTGEARDARVTALTALLALREVGQDTFAGGSGGEGLYGGPQRRYGGELLAQALCAAQRTVAAQAGDDARPVHSLHAYFIRPAHPARDVEYRVRRVRDGRSFSIRSVEGWQDDTLAFVLDASFQRPERGFVHDAPAPAVPTPEALPTEQSRFEAARRADPGRFAAWPAGWHADRGPFETRTVEDLWGTTVQPPQMHTWVRLRAPVGDLGLHPSIAAYYSDDPVMDNALLPHVGRYHDGALTTASLDHAMWFHEPVDLHDWHLFAQDSPVASGARGLTRGLLFDRAGRLVASVAQEILMRVRT